MKVDVELEPFTPLLRPTYADAHAGAISEVRMEGYEFGHTYVWQGPERGPLDSEGHKEQKKVEVQGNYRFETTRLASTFLDLCVSSLRRGHANLLCIVPILTDIPEGNPRRGLASKHKF